MEPKAELRKIIYELTDFILDVASEVRVKHESVIYEDEHANLTVYPPLYWDEEKCDVLQDMISERVSDLHFETGYLILVDVLEPEQQVATAQCQLLSAHEAVEAAEKILAEAQQLGLWQSNPTNSELIPA